MPSLHPEEARLPVPFVEIMDEPMTSDGGGART